jgi:hypothetical protein
MGILLFVVKLLMYHLINMSTYVIGQKVYFNMKWTINDEKMR